jgi:hypothetical protein
MELVKRKLVLLILLCICHFSKAQEHSEVGLMVGYADQTFVNVAYNYQVFFIQAQFFRTLLEQKNYELEFVVQPQYNRSYINTEAGRNNGYEFGLNLGLSMMYKLADSKWSFYIMGSIGPHVISIAPSRQMPGFLFSDNLFLGILFKVNEQFRLELRPGFRHVSNAGLFSPNGGINTSVVNIGFRYRFQENLR